MATPPPLTPALPTSKLSRVALSPSRLSPPEAKINWVVFPPLCPVPGGRLKTVPPPTVPRQDWFFQRPPFNARARGGLSPRPVRGQFPSRPHLANRCFSPGGRPGCTAGRRLALEQPFPRHIIPPAPPDPPQTPCRFEESDCGVYFQNAVRLPSSPRKRRFFPMGPPAVTLSIRRRPNDIRSKSDTSRAPHLRSHLFGLPPPGPRPFLPSAHYTSPHSSLCTLARPVWAGPCFVLNAVHRPPSSPPLCPFAPTWGSQFPTGAGLAKNPPGPVHTPPRPLGFSHQRFPPPPPTPLSEPSKPPCGDAVYCRPPAGPNRTAGTEPQGVEGASPRTRAQNLLRNCGGKKNHAATKNLTLLFPTLGKWAALPRVVGSRLNSQIPSASPNPPPPPPPPGRPFRKTCQKDQPKPDRFPVTRAAESDTRILHVCLAERTRVTQSRGYVP